MPNFILLWKFYPTFDTSQTLKKEMLKPGMEAEAGMLCLQSLTNNLNWIKNKKLLMHFTFMPCSIRIFTYMTTNSNCTHENTLTCTYILYDHAWKLHVSVYVHAH